MLPSLLARTLETAGPPAAATTAAVALCGRVDDGSAVAPLNAISHILWGDEAARCEHADLEHTATGVALNTAAIASWAAVYEMFFGGSARRGNVAAALAGGAAVSAFAYVTDYYVVPKRLTPGFEKRLSPLSMLAVYATLAATLPLASLAAARRPSSPPPSQVAPDSPWRGGARGGIPTATAAAAKTTKHAFSPA